MTRPVGEDVQGRSTFGNRHSEPCRSNVCPCYKAGQDSLVAALAQRDDEIESGEAWQRAKADGYREACELFAAELEAGREARRQLAEFGSTAAGAAETHPTGDAGERGRG